MKNIHNLYRSSIVIAAGIASLALLPSAQAQLTLRYEEAGGGHNVGDLFTGSFRITFGNFDMGSIYGPRPVGTSIGFGQNGTGTQSIEGGISTLNSQQVFGATNAQLFQTTVGGVPQGAATVGPEDSWGIARVSSITDTAGFKVFTEEGKNAQITVFFYGEKDFYLNQYNPDSQEIDGVGLHADFYYQSKSGPGYTPFDPTLGSAGRTGATTYANVTDGINIFNTVSEPGFIHNAGTAGGLATEFSSRFNPNAGGDGQTYLSVTTGTQAAQFNTNGFTGFIPGKTADIFAQFTTRALGTPGNPPVADWLVSSDGPAIGSLALTPVPEPSTYGFAAAGILVAMTALRRRFRRQAQA